MSRKELDRYAALTEEGDPYANRLLCLSLDIGEEILKSGGEIQRVEDTVERICRAYGAVHVEIFAIHSLIIASVRMADGGYSSQIRRIYQSANHLATLEAFNRISRVVCRKRPDLDELDAMIKHEKCRSVSPLWSVLISYAIIAGPFALLFGGSLRDGAAGALVALLLGLISRIRSNYITPLAKTLLISFVAGVLSYLSVLVGIGENVDMIMIGTIMLLIPGLAFGNAIRDLLCGDTVAGLLKTVQSCLSAILIACGYALSLFLLGPYVPSAEGITVVLHPAVEWIAVLLGTVGFAMLFHVRAKHIPVISLMGILTYALYTLSLHVGLSQFVSAFFALIVVSLCAEGCARIFQAPTVVFLYPAPVVIVPGGSLYYTMSALLLQKETLLEAHLQNTLQISIGIAAGIVTVSVLVQCLTRMSAHLKLEKERKKK